ncbi:hypothetical protein F5884DRAFT_781890 [Xylogone sp. PMI_703]|nr:hypothetical protein F5884DRAFT_781890 [Xylogone sp. PMI_703]
MADKQIKQMSKAEETSNKISFIEEDPTKGSLTPQSSYLFVPHQAIKPSHHQNTKWRSHVQRFSKVTKNKLVKKTRNLLPADESRLRKEKKAPILRGGSQYNVIGGEYAGGTQSRHSWSLPQAQARSKFNHSISSYGTLNNITNPLLPSPRLRQHEIQLLDYFFKTINPRVFPIPRIAELHQHFITSHAMYDEVVLLPLLSYCAAWMKREKGVSSSFVEILPHFQLVFKIRAIAKISQRMQSISQATEITTIYGIICLLACELLEGDTTALKINAHGLRHLIHQRGGLDTLPLEMLDLTVRALQMSAMLMQTSNSLFLPIITPWDPLPLLKSQACQDFQKIGSGFEHPDVIQLLGESLSLTVLHLRLLVKFDYSCQKSPYPYNPSNQETDCFLRGLYSIPQSLHVIVQEKPENSIMHRRKAVAIGMLIFCYSRRYPTQSSTPVFRELASQLEGSLEISGHLPLSVPATELLIWTAFQGACICSSETFKLRYLRHIAKLSHQSGLQAWEDTNIMLCKYFFRSMPISYEPFQTIWEESRKMYQSFAH